MAVSRYISSDRRSPSMLQLKPRAMIQPLVALTGCNPIKNFKANFSSAIILFGAGEISRRLSLAAFQPWIVARWLEESAQIEMLQPLPEPEIVDMEVARAASPSSAPEAIEIVTVTEALESTSLESTEIIEENCDILELEPETSTSVIPEHEFIVIPKPKLMDAAEEEESEGKAKDPADLTANLLGFDREKRLAAAVLLAVEGDESSLIALEQGARYADWQLRETCLNAVGELGYDAGEPILLAALGDENWRVREAAARGLAKLNYSDIQNLADKLADADWRVREGAARALGKSGKAGAATSLVAALRDGNAKVRQVAMESLVTLGDKAASALTKALSDAETEVRRRAAVLLGEIKAKDSAQMLLPLLKDRHWQVRLATVQTLGKLQDESCLAGLAALVKDKHPDVRVAAIEAMAAFGAAAGEELDKLLQHKDVDIRRRAASALESAATPKALPRLLVMLREEDELTAKEASRALAGLGEAAVKELIATLQDEKDVVRMRVAATLAKIDAAPARRTLLEALEKRDLAAVAGGHEFYIKEGLNEAEGLLINALSVANDLTMAENFLYCGNEALQDAGRKYLLQSGLPEVPEITVEREFPFWGGKAPTK